MGKHRHRDDDDESGRDKKKASKKAAKVAKMLGYSNEINPFGDANLLQPFVWGKKTEKDKKDGKFDTGGEDKRLDLLKDIDRVRKRREDREKELEEMERLRTEEQRLRESLQYGDWQQKEEEFHMEQTRVRSKIRLVEGRQQPIDSLSMGILLVESDRTAEKEQKAVAVRLAKCKAELRNPIDIVSQLSLSELQTLVIGVDSFIQMEVKKSSGASLSSSTVPSYSGEYSLYWESLKKIIVHQIEKLVAKQRDDRDTGKRTLIHKSVKKEIDKMLQGRNMEQLKELESDVMHNIERGSYSASSDGRSSGSGQGFGDVEYWESVVKEVRLEIARCHVEEIYESLITQQKAIISRLKTEERESRKSRKDSNNESDDDKDTMNWLGMPEAAPASASDMTQGESQLMQRSEENSEKDKMEENMGNKDEVNLPIKTYSWQDKYRPRKPRYFNRVKTGYDWNLYNRTHYDHDNPPPKTVQGYKFNIFYPDLIDSTKAPKYSLEGAPEPELAILRFSAGPPYEDIAFKIVNQQWDTNVRGGFRVSFERGVLQLHFNFKRSFYRR